MMKANSILTLLAAAAVAVACNAKTQQFSAADGSVTAVYNERSHQWAISGPDGREVVPDYDSMRVTEVSADGHPVTVVYYKGNRQHWLQYYSTMQLRSEGEMVDGRRHGRWVFYHSNGNIQSECTYVDGREEGPYRVYRENGVPYYIGQYTAGQRSGTWEVYDADGQIVEKREF